MQRERKREREMRHVAKKHCRFISYAFYGYRYVYYTHFFAENNENHNKRRKAEKMLLLQKKTKRTPRGDPSTLIITLVAAVTVHLCSPDEPACAQPVGISTLFCQNNKNVHFWPFLFFAPPAFTFLYCVY